MCSYLTGAQSTGRAVTPPAAPTSQIWRIWAREWKSGRFAGEHDAGGSRRRWKSRRVSRAVRSSLAACHVVSGSKAKTASRVGRFEMAGDFTNLSIGNRQSAFLNLLCRHSGCRAGPHHASRIRMPASNPTSRAIGRRTLAAVRAGLGRYARASERACRWRATARRHARARFWQWKVFRGARGGSKGKPLPRLKRKSSGGFAVLVDERFNELGDLALLIAGQLAGPLEHLPQLACRTFAARLCGVAAKDIFDGDMQS